MLTLEEARIALLELESESKFNQMLYTAAILTDVLLQEGIKPIIVVGMSVEIYTLSGYTTQDVDFVLNEYEKASSVLNNLGFKKVGRSWVHPILGVSLEIPSNELTGDYDKVTELVVGEQKVYLIGIEDIILDRLRSALHWKSGVDREWGYRLLLMYLEEVDVDYINSNFQDISEKNEFELWLKEASAEKHQIDE